MGRIAFCFLLLQLAARAQQPTASPSPRPTATPLTLFIKPGQAEVKALSGVLGPGQLQAAKLWSDQVVRALLRVGFTVVDDPKQKHDADVKLAVSINPQQNHANLIVTIEQGGKLVDVIEEFNRARWATDAAANLLANHIKGSPALVAFSQKRRGPSNLDKAKQLHESATKKFDLGMFADAVKDWTRAYQLDPHAQFLYNIGNAYRRKGEIEHNAEDLRRAQYFYHRYGENDPTVDIKNDLRETDALLKKLDGKPATR
jgi:tetratricopeptide (TPR) repeat protein